MKKAFTLHLPPAFEAACLMYGLEPTLVLQTFIDSILLHGKETDARPVVRQATAVLDYCRLRCEPHPLPYTAKQKKYILVMAARHRTVVQRIAGQSLEAQERALMKFYERWMKGWEEL